MLLATLNITIITEMKNVLILLSGVSFVAPFVLSAATYTATLPESSGANLWTDAAIWNAEGVPSVNQSIANITGAAGASLLIDSQDLSAIALKYNLRDASVNVTNSRVGGFMNGNSNFYLSNSTMTFEDTFLQIGDGPSAPATSAAVYLTGNSLFSVTQTDSASGSFEAGSFFRVILQDNSVFSLTGATVAGGYIGFYANGTSSIVLDNSKWEKTAWSPLELVENATLTIKNGGAMGITGLWGESHYTAFADDSVVNLLDGGTFSNTQQTNVTIKNNALVNISSSTATNSSFTAGNGGLYLQDSATINVNQGGRLIINAKTLATADASSLTGNASINVFGGGTVVGLQNITIASATASINFEGSDADNLATAQMGGNFITDSVGAVNFNNFSVLDRTGTALVIGGTSKININAGATLKANSGHSITLQDNGVLTVDGGTFENGSFPQMVATGNAEFNFKNGAKTAGTFAMFNFSGNAKLNVEDATFNMQPYNGVHWTFGGTSSLNLTNNATFSANGSFGAPVTNLVFSDSAVAKISSSTLRFNAAGQGVVFNGNSSALLLGTAARKSSLTVGFLQLNSVSASDHASVSLTGYSNMEASEDVSLGDSASALGRQSISLSGVSNVFSAKNLNMDKNSEFNISGSTHTITLSGALSAGSGTMMNFTADADGISTFDAAEILLLDSVLTLDFSLFEGDPSQTYVMELIVADADWSLLANKYETSSDNAFIRIIKANAEDTWELYYADNKLYISYETVVVPEPSTYAAIFGALALALAAYRRKKQTL